MMGIVSCPCPCSHTFIAEMHPNENGSRVALLWTTIPKERKTLLERWIGSTYQNVDAPDSYLHTKLMPTTPDRVFAAMVTEFKALIVVVRKEVGDVPTYRQYLDGYTGKPPNVLFGLNLVRAKNALFYAGGVDSTCDACGEFKPATISSVLDGKRICKKCKEVELIMENDVEAHEIGMICATGVPAT